MLLLPIKDLYCQETIAQSDSITKSLVVIGFKKNMWSKTEMLDSIDWPNVNSIKMLTPKEAMLKYGKLGSNGAAIVTYKPQEFNKFPKYKMKNIQK